MKNNGKGLPKIDEMGTFDKIMIETQIVLANCIYYLVTYSLPIEICRKFMLE